MRQEKKEEEDLPALKRASMLQYKDSKNIFKKSKERPFTATTKQYRQIMINRKKLNSDKKCGEKQLYLYFKRQTGEISLEKIWTEQIKRSLKRETGSLLIVAQNSAIRTNYVKAKINKRQQNSKINSCIDRDEIIDHLIHETSPRILIFSWFGSSLPSVVSRFPLYIIRMAHFLPNSIPMSQMYILTVFGYSIIFLFWPTIWCRLRILGGWSFPAI